MVKIKTSTKLQALFFLLFALTTSPFPKPAFADQLPEPVFDILRQTVLPIDGNVKALTLALVNHSCPLNVVLYEKPKIAPIYPLKPDETALPLIYPPKPVDTALPLKFYPAKPGDNVVYTNTNLNLEFSYKSDGDCKGYSTVWSLARSNYITTEGVAGNYGDLSTFHNWFKIVKAYPYENRYYFNFSTSIINSICPCCQDSEIGIINPPHGQIQPEIAIKPPHGKIHQLVLSKKPLEVVFEGVDNIDLHGYTTAS